MNAWLEQYIADDDDDDITKKTPRGVHYRDVRVIVRNILRSWPDYVPKEMAAEVVASLVQDMERLASRAHRLGPRDPELINGKWYPPK